MTIAGPTSSLPVINAAQAAGDDADDDGPGLASQWIRRDPVAAVVLLLILIQLAWRAKIGLAGYMEYDDFYLAILAHENKLSVSWLFQHFNNHLMPGGLLYVWLVTKAFGYAYWPYLTLMLVWQAILSLSFFRLLRQVVTARWGLLVPMCLFLFSPLGLEPTSWWVVGVNLLPAELAMVWAMGAQVKYVRTGNLRHLISLGLAMLFGFTFGEKTLLVGPLVFLFTVCLLTRGSPGRSIWRALKRQWPAWLVLLGLSAPYVYLYQLHPDNLPSVKSLDDVLRFLGQFFGQTVVPGLLGGPWEWWYTEGPPLVSPGPTLSTLAGVFMVGLMVFTIWRRPRAIRAWILLLGYAGAVAALIAVGRLGFGLGSIAGLVPRYASDIVVVAALAIGAALFGVQRIPDKTVRNPAWLTNASTGPVPTAALGAVVALFAIGAVISTNGYAKAWAIQPGRDYLATVQQELAKAPAGTVFFDQTTPSSVMIPYQYPVNLQSRVFALLPKQPVFVTEAERLWVFDDKGHIRPAWVEPGVKLVPGPVPNCGHSLNGGKPATLPLTGSVIEWPWIVRIAYLSSGDSEVTLRIGKQAQVFSAKQGLHEYFFHLTADGPTLEIDVHNPAVHLCTNEVTIGNLVPKAF
jgi:hypothetical protein